ncbi:hypothetical protein BDZ91DRAFT_156825 [Kalaharituber pfeilii]|nr:hypothetical protein BDZ91DRAFT_156825 [Kalaharituber pfeilii]
MARWSWALGNRPNYRPYRVKRLKGVPRLPSHYAAVTKQRSPSLYSNPLETLRNYHKNSTTFQGQHEHVPHAPMASLIQLYYAYFHSSHPFMLPPAYLVKTNAAKLTHLMPVVRYIGSFFAPTAPRNSFRDAAEYTLFRQNAARNGYTVQAMLLFAIGLHAANEQEKSGQVKDAAIEIALEIGMNREEFAYFGGERIPDDVLMTDNDSGSVDDGLDAKRNTTDPVERVMQESWRRTWWELYFLDGILAGVHQTVDGFRLWMVECSVPLPCEEAEYNNGKIPPPRSLQEFDDRTFSDEALEFSSYAYRVEAIRILGQVLACGHNNDPDDPRADAADASLVNWALHLPDEKKELVGKDRKVDEMLFQAHMIVYATSIYLHRPRSHLVVSLVSDETTCTPTTGYTSSHHPVVFHTSKAVYAANAISKLVTLPTPLIKHSPFFTCVLTLATIVHLSACSWLLSGDEGYLAKERIRLGIGALKTLEDVWGIAGCVLQQIKAASREVFRFPRPEGWAAEFVGAGGIITEEEMMRFIEEEGALEGDVAEMGIDEDMVQGTAGLLVGVEGEMFQDAPVLDSWDGS